MVGDSIRAIYHKLDPKSRLHTYEIFGYDFMIDENFRVYLIEVNANPCLEITSPVTARVVPSMLDSAFRYTLIFHYIYRIGIDPVFSPPADLANPKKAISEILPEIRHELIFDEKIDAKELIELRKGYENIIGKPLLIYDIVEIKDEEENECESDSENENENEGDV